MNETPERRLREELRAALLARGFARVGFTGAAPVDDVATPWVTAGRHASMLWMERTPAARADPSALLPGARTVICVGAAYPATDGSGAIAGYARAEDYHRTLRAALEDGVAWLLDRRPDAVTRICVDSAPLLERSFAARAGLGWIGRNTMLLDEQHGPWMLLAEILTDVALPPDEPGPFRCGTCTACVDACPTDALDGAGHLDARRCLSYWSIEHRGPLPAEWSAALGHRAFGCDDCLAACPFPAAQGASSGPGETDDNRRRDPDDTPHAADAPWQLRPDLVDITHDELAERSGESFKRHFGSTPLERARKGGLLRNLGRSPAP